MARVMHFAVAYILAGRRVLRFTYHSEMKSSYAFPSVCRYEVWTIMVWHLKIVLVGNTCLMGKTAKYLTRHH